MLRSGSGVHRRYVLPRTIINTVTLRIVYYLFIYLFNSPCASCTYHMVAGNPQKHNCQLLRGPKLIIKYQLYTIKFFKIPILRFRKLTTVDSVFQLSLDELAGKC